MENVPINLSVFTLNVWGLPSWLAKEKPRRVHGIAEMLASNSFDIVCLQEVWCKDDFEVIKKICKNALPHSCYYYSGFCGSGLCLFSKWPIIKTFFSQWSLNGYIHMIHHGDWYGGKGVAIAQICHTGHIINIYNTHLIAKYAENDIYQTHRLVQAFDTGMITNLTSADATLSIICGDLNSTPENICTRLIKNIANIHDTYDAENKNGKENCGTNEVFTNSFTKPQFRQVDNKGSRIDYVLYRPGKNVKVDVISYDLPYSKIPGTDISYSDHEPVLIHMNFLKSSLGVPYPGEHKFDVELLHNAIYECESGIILIKKNWQTHLVLILLLLFFLNFMSILIPSYNFFLCVTLYPVIFYLIVMVTVWYRIELNGILSAIQRLKTLLIDCQSINKF